MGAKDEIRQAKEHIDYMKAKGHEFDEIVLSLNMTFDGFYYLANGCIYRENVPDYAPPVRLM